MSINEIIINNPDLNEVKKIADVNIKSIKMKPESYHNTIGNVSRNLGNDGIDEVKTDYVSDVTIPDVGEVKNESVDNELNIKIPEEVHNDFPKEIYEDKRILNDNINVLGSIETVKGVGNRPIKLNGLMYGNALKNAKFLNENIITSYYPDGSIEYVSSKNSTLPIEENVDEKANSEDVVVPVDRDEEKEDIADIEENTPKYENEENKIDENSIEENDTFISKNSESSINTFDDSVEDNDTNSFNFENLFKEYANGLVDDKDDSEIKSVSFDENSNNTFNFNSSDEYNISDLVNNFKISNEKLSDLKNKNEDKKVALDEASSNVNSLKDKFIKAREQLVKLQEQNDALIKELEAENEKMDKEVAEYNNEAEMLGHNTDELYRMINSDALQGDDTSSYSNVR